jgi:asparagine synthase (glutamine-hydrolysing)
MMLLDVLTYLPDDILAKVDRASMRVSLECRAPLLDHRVVEFAGRLSQDLKYREGKSKWVLRQVLYRYVPAALIERPKMGFEVPVGLWLRGPLKDWAQALLEPARLDREGILNARLLSEKWAEHLSERYNWGPQLWNALMFLAWLESER